MDYVEMRRATFGAELGASLARLGSDAPPVPPEIYQTRVMRELQTAAHDCACFINDLFSYQKEIQFEGERHNLVLVVQRFLDVDRWQAAEIVARLMRSRMEQFERLTSVGLAKLAADYDLTPAAVTALSREAELLGDWMSGVLEWHRNNPRYADAELRRLHYGFTLAPTGLGTSAARAGAASTAAGV
jgi:germacradienol/geosmin synthase